jgi:hypothetical protein
LFGHVSPNVPYRTGNRFLDLIRFNLVPTSTLFGQVGGGHLKLPKFAHHYLERPPLFRFCLFLLLLFSRKYYWSNV